MLLMSGMGVAYNHLIVNKWSCIQLSRMALQIPSNGMDYNVEPLDMEIHLSRNIVDLFIEWYCKYH